MIKLRYPLYHLHKLLESKKIKLLYEYKEVCVVTLSFLCFLFLLCFLFFFFQTFFPHFHVFSFLYFLYFFGALCCCCCCLGQRGLKFRWNSVHKTVTLWKIRFLFFFFFCPFLSFFLSCFHFLFIYHISSNDNLDFIGRGGIVILVFNTRLSHSCLTSNTADVVYQTALKSVHFYWIPRCLFKNWILYGPTLGWVLQYVLYVTKDLELTNEWWTQMGKYFTNDASCE